MRRLRNEEIEMRVRSETRGEFGGVRRLKILFEDGGNVTEES